MGECVTGGGGSDLPANIDVMQLALILLFFSQSEKCEPRIAGSIPSMPSMSANNEVTHDL